MTDGSNREHRLLLIAALSSVVTALVLIAAKTLAWVMTGSVSMLASLVDSVMDSMASLINFFAIRYSLVPADEEHRFGHGKAEALAGLGQAIFIAGSSLFLIQQSVAKLMDPTPIQASTVGIRVRLGGQCGHYRRVGGQQPGLALARWGGGARHCPVHSAQCLADRIRGQSVITGPGNAR